MSTLRIRNVIIGLLAVTTFVGLSGTAQAVEEEPPAPSRGCPYGAVCIYPGTSWNGGNPSHVFWDYGAHKFYDQYGMHRVYNNQYDGAWAMICKGSNGGACTHGLKQGLYIDYNLSEMNSLKLLRD